MENVPSMWVKTAIRRIMKRVPKSAEQRFIQVDGMSGSNMNHLKTNSEIIDISAEDFYSINLNDKSGQNTSTPKNKEPENKKHKNSKEVKQALYLAGVFPSLLEKVCEQCDIPLGLAVESYDVETAVKFCKKMGELVDQQEGNQ